MRCPRRAAAMIGMLCLTLPGCDVTRLVKEDAAQVDLQARWRQSKNDFVIVFEVIPRMPEQGQEADFQVSIHDESKEPSQPVAGATIIGIAVMPSMPGYFRELELRSGMGASEPGAYRARSSFDIKGEWLAKLQIRLSSGQRINAEFPFRVSGSISK